MIGSTGQGSGFGGVQVYLLRGRGEVDPSERVAWTSVRNLLSEDLDLAPAEMQAVASQNPRTGKPVYHVSLNAAPGEHLTREQWEEAADRVLAALALEEHQALLVAHKDRAHEHVHLVVNRVHPVTHRAANLHRDWPRIEKVMRGVERDFGLRRVPGHHARDAGQEPPDRAAGFTSGERHGELRTGEAPWAEEMRFQLYNHVKEARSWADLEARLAEHEVRLEARGRGLVVTDGERQVKLSRIHRGSSAHRLAERFGESWKEWREGVGEALEAVREYERAEARRGRISDRVARAERTLDDVASRRAPLERLSARVRELSARLDHQLAGVYRPEELRRVRRRLDHALRTGGVQELGEELAARPSRLGRLLGRGGPLATSERHEAVRVAARAARTLEQLAAARSELVRELPKAAGAAPQGPGRSTPTETELAQNFRLQRRNLRQAERMLRRGRGGLRKIPPRQHLLERVAEAAGRLGIQLVERAAGRGMGTGRATSATRKALALGRTAGRSQLAGQAARFALRTAGGVTAQALGVVIPAPALQVVRLALAAGRGLARAGHAEIQEGQRS